jgi:hypothetical protein
MSTAVHRSPNKIWRYISIFHLWQEENGTREKGARNNNSKTMDFGIRDKKYKIFSGRYTEEKVTRADSHKQLISTAGW